MVNVQGDEPLLPPQAIDLVAQAVEVGDMLATLAESVCSAQEFHSPGAVKVVVDARGDALYFSRAPIPWPRDCPKDAPEGVLRHIGVYAYRLECLRRFAALPECALERVERLEQLRALHAGLRVAVRLLPQGMEPGVGVDTAEDAARVQRLLEARA